MRYIILDSGDIAPARPMDRRTTFAVWHPPLPVQYQMGSIRLNVALQILVGPAWQLWVDDVQREVLLRPEYTPSAPDAE